MEGIGRCYRGTRGHLCANEQRFVRRFEIIQATSSQPSNMIEPLLLTTTLVRTFDGQRALTAASGFFFARGEAIFLVTNRHVLLDGLANHRPNRIEFDLHSDPQNLTLTKVVSMWLYVGGRSQWRQGGDSGGDVDVAVIAIPPEELPSGTGWRCFTPAHLLVALDQVRVGRSLLILGFPLGFHDTVHHLPVARQATVASAFGVRFQGQGHFLTDGRTHRGSSGGPVVMPDVHGDPEMPWKLLGVHASRFDMRTRDGLQDESLGLNSAWYADILMTLTGGGFADLLVSRSPSETACDAIPRPETALAERA